MRANKLGVSFPTVREQSATLVLVTHEAALAARAGRLIELKDGRVVADRATAPA